MLKQNFTVRECSEISGLSIYTVDYLCKQGLIVPTGSKKTGKGKKRYFKFGDLALLRVAKFLLEKGVSVSNLIRASKTWRSRFKYLNSDYDTPLPNKAFLVTDGKNVYFKDKNEILENLSSNGQLEFNFFLINIEKIREDCFTEISNIKRA